MKSTHDYLAEYRRQMQLGDVPTAYRFLMEFMQNLKNRFRNRYPGYALPGSLYPGYMDMTYFSIVPPALADRKLKIAIVLLHDTVSLEVWLSGVNKQVQEQYWKRFRESGWSRYRIPNDIKGLDSIVEADLAADPDFSDPEGLMDRIEENTLTFIRAIEEFLEK